MDEKIPNLMDTMKFVIEGNECSCDYSLDPLYTEGWALRKKLNY